MPKKGKSKRGKKGGSRGPSERAQLGGPVTIYRAPESSLPIFKRRLVYGNPTTVKTDSTGTMGGTAVPANGLLTVGTTNWSTLFTTANTILDITDTITVHRIGFRVLPVSNNPGTTMFAFDFADSSNTSYAIIMMKNGMPISNSNTSAKAGDQNFEAALPPRAPFNEAFVANANPIPWAAYLRVWTDASNFGSANSTLEFTLIPYAIVTGYGRDKVV